MSVMSVRVNDEKKKKLKAVASLEGKTMSKLMEELIDRYLEEYQKKGAEYEQLNELMQASEPSFGEWDNPEDEVYDDL